MLIFLNIISIIIKYLIKLKYLFYIKKYKEKVLFYCEYICEIIITSQKKTCKSIAIIAIKGFNCYRFPKIHISEYLIIYLKK